MKSCYTIFIVLLVLVLGFSLASVAGNEKDPRLARSVSPTIGGTIQPTIPLSVNATILYVDSLNGLNDTTSLKARGYKPYYRGTGPQGTTATWYQGVPTVFPAYNGDSAGYVAANYNVVTGTNNIDSWLVFPRLNLQAGDSLKFFERSPLNSTFPDSVRVMYSGVGDSIPEAASWVELGRFKTTIDGTWRQRLFAAPTSGATARYAIRYAVVNGGPSGANSNYIGIDMITVERTAVAGQPQYYNYNTTGTTNSFPFNIPLGKEIQVLFLSGDFAQPSPAPAGNITTVFFRLAANLGPYTYSNVVIKMGQTDLTTFATGVWYTGQLDTVYYRASVTLGGLANEWVSISLDRPFQYNPARSLVIDVQQCAAPGATGFSSGTTPLAGFRRNTSLVGASCPLPWGQQSGSVHHMGVNIVPGGTTYGVPDLLYYPFENSSTGFTPNAAIPGVGTNPAPYTGTISSGGQFDSALVETGLAGQGVTTGWNLNIGARSWTIGMWVQIPTSASGSAFYLFGDLGSGSFRCFHNGVALPDNLILRGTGITDVTVTGIGPAPTFVHLVYDSATVTIKAYKNGVLANTVVQAAPLNIVVGTGFKAGGYSTSAGFSGAMDEFRFYSRALDTAEIRQTWNHTLPYNPITGVTPSLAELPTTYTLEQNYPNPFNPTTTIQYGLPAAANVTLKIYNVLGQEVITLVNEQKNPGTFQVVWNGDNSVGNRVASGVYFYSLVARSADNASTFTNIKKMLFLK